jgi:hypothetical protein
VHQVGDQPRLYYDARSTNHQKNKNSLVSFLFCPCILTISVIRFVVLYSVPTSVLFSYVRLLFCVPPNISFIGHELLLAKSSSRVTNYNWQRKLKRFHPLYTNPGPYLVKKMKTSASDWTYINIHCAVPKTDHHGQQCYSALTANSLETIFLLNSA